MLPGNTLFGGIYGIMIIENDIEPSLKGTVLPLDADTFTLAMSDIDFDVAGKVGKPFGGDDQDPERADRTLPPGRHRRPRRNECRLRPLLGPPAPPSW